jgi:rod shape-determining protein MreC
MRKTPSRLVLAGILLLASLAIMAVSQLDALQPVRDVLTYPLAAVQRWTAGAFQRASDAAAPKPEAEELRETNATQAAEIVKLKSENVALQDTQAQMAVLSALLDYARTQPDRRYVAANVIGRDPSSYLNYIILDRGSDAGIQRDMPVITAEGLVGRVSAVTGTACKVALVTDPLSAVDARLLISREEGVVVGKVGGGLELRFISQQAEIQPGEVVLTSGLGGKYPEGIVLGTVNAVQKLEYEVLQTADLVPAVTFNRLEIVLIITDFRPLDFTPFTESTATP